MQDHHHLSCEDVGGIGSPSGVLTLAKIQSDPHWKNKNPSHPFDEVFLHGTRPAPGEQSPVAGTQDVEAQAFSSRKRKAQASHRSQVIDLDDVPPASSSKDIAQKAQLLPGYVIVMDASDPISE